MKSGWSIYPNPLMCMRWDLGRGRLVEDILSTALRKRCILSARARKSCRFECTGPAYEVDPELEFAAGHHIPDSEIGEEWKSGSSLARLTLQLLVRAVLVAKAKS